MRMLFPRDRPLRPAAHHRQSAVANPRTAKSLTAYSLGSAPCILAPAAIQESARARGHRVDFPGSAMCADAKTGLEVGRVETYRSRSITYETICRMNCL